MFSVELIRDTDIYLSIYLSIYLLTNIQLNEK